ncbi:hypothetical protein YTPLAS72_24790 [Nitrospira sp.]|nr:hypothetical protein YTPLAS72_24790 [Nitrospira sp.]
MLLGSVLLNGLRHKNSPIASLFSGLGKTITLYKMGSVYAAGAPTTVRAD